MCLDQRVMLVPQEQKDCQDCQEGKELMVSLDCKEGITPKPDKFEYFCHSCDRWAGIQHARIRIGCSKLKSHLYNNLHVIEEESCQCGHRSEDPFHFFFECPRYVALRNNLITSVAQHTDCSLQTILFGDPELNHKQNLDIFDAVQHFVILSKRFD